MSDVQFRQIRRLRRPIGCLTCLISQNRTCDVQSRLKKPCENAKKGTAWLGVRHTTLVREQKCVKHSLEVAPKQKNDVKYTLESDVKLI